MAISRHRGALTVAVTLAASAAVTVLLVDRTPPNSAPTVAAGAAATVTATSTHTLAASCSDDGLPYNPGVLMCSWEQIGGTGCTFETGADDFECEDDTSPDFDVTCDESEGASLQLCCDDDGSGGANPEVCGIVVITAHTAPVTSAGSDNTVATSTPYSLDGTCTDDGLPNSARTCTWAQTTAARSVSMP